MSRFKYYNILFFRFAAAALISVGISGCSPNPGAGDKIKVAGVFSSSLEDPMAAVIYQSLRKAVQEMDVVCDVTDNVPSEDMKRVLNDYVEKGYLVIFGVAPDSEAIIRRFARDYPEIAFCFCSALGPSAPNLSVFNSWVYEPAYLCGLIAGRRTKTNIVGAVGPLPDPAVNCLLNAFHYGVQEANPSARVISAFIESPFDPPAAARAADSLIAAGADYLFAGTPGVIRTCREKGVVAFGNLQDQYSLAQNTVISGTVWDLWPMVEKVITDVEDDRYQAQDMREWSMMAKGGAFLAPYHSFDGKISLELKDMIDQIRRDIMTGTFRVPANELPPPLYQPDRNPI
jgi:basic membrane protein A and related proteins